MVDILIWFFMLTFRLMALTIEVSVLVITALASAVSQQQASKTSRAVRENER